MLIFCSTCSGFFWPINGEITADLEDRETGKATASGVLAMPIIPGEPMKVQYKDIQLKVLSKKGLR